MADSVEAVALPPDEGAPVLLDTDVFSYLMRGGDKAKPWIPLVEDKYLLMAFASIAELLVWSKKNWQAKKQALLEAKLETVVVVPYNFELVERWAELKVWATTQHPQHPIGLAPQANDAWVAATALLYDLPLLSNNTKHLAGIPDLMLVQPPHSD